METLDYWTPADALAFRCSVGQVGTLKPAAPSTPCDAGSADLREDVAEARRYAPRALRALVRIMEAGESRAALEAARELLTRAYGPPLAQAPERPPLPGPQEAEPSPEWLDGQRLAYQNRPGQCLPEQHQTRQCLPGQSLTPAVSA